MKIFRKIKGLLDRGHSSDDVRNVDASGAKKIEFSWEDTFNKTLLEAEAAYQHQDRKIERFGFGEEIALGKIIDFLLDSDVTKHITGLSVCPSRIEGSNNSAVFTKDINNIKDYNILKLMTWTDENGELHPLTGENVTMTVLRDNGLPIVLFVRNMHSMPGLLYIRIYSLVNGTNANDDMRIQNTMNIPLIKSTLISCRTNNDDLSEKMKLYKGTEAQVLQKIERNENLDNNLQAQVAEGMFGWKGTSEYNGYGDWLYSLGRYSDAQRQYIRMINYFIPYPADNIDHGDFFGEMNYKMAQSLLHTNDAVSAFHYMDIAHFFNANISEEYLMTLAKLTDYRFHDILSKESAHIGSNKQQELEQMYNDSKNRLQEQLTRDLPYLSLGFLLSQLLRVHKYNIFSLHIFRLKGTEYQYERIDDKEEVWNHPVAELLQDGNTITIGYSRTEYDCHLQDDHSILCAANSIIMHADKIPGKEHLRVNVMIPAFSFDPDKLSLTKKYFPEYHTFIVSTQPYVYDFTKQEKEIVQDASKLYSERRTIEALLGCLHAYHKLLVEFEDACVEKQYDCLDAAARTGECFLDLDVPYVADYYLNVGLATMVADYVGEYTNCLVNTKDVRAMSLIDNMLLKHFNLGEEANKKWKAYFRRRKAYLLIDWGMIPQAKDMLRSLLKDPLCSDFAHHELEYLEQNGL